MVSFISSNFGFINTVKADEIDEQQTDNSSNLAIGGMYPTLAIQTFIPDATSISKIEIFVASAPASGSYTLLVKHGETTLGGISLSDISTGWVTFDFDDIEIMPGYIYDFQFFYTGAQSVYIGYSNVNPYSKGMLYYGLVEKPSWDLAFKIYSASSNSAPDKPVTPSGLSTLDIGQLGSFSTSTSDPDGDDVYYKFKWEEGLYSAWLGPYGSGESISKSRSWDSPGVYDVMVKAKDIHDNVGPWSDTLSVTVGSGNSAPNKPSTPSGPISLKIGEMGYFSTSTTDPDEDNVYYRFKWQEGLNSAWLGPSSSGETVQHSHSWDTPGTYNIMVKAKDEFNNEGPWSDSLTVEIYTDPKPDLYTKHIHITPNVFKTGDSVEVTGDVANIGQEDITESFKVRLYLDDQLISEETWNGLGINQGDWIRKTIVWPDDNNHKVKLYADYENNINESNENNNYEEKTYTSSKPDLTITALWTDPEDFDSKDTVKLKFIVKNIGLVDCDGFWIDITVYCEIEDESIGFTEYVNGLDPSECRTITKDIYWEYVNWVYIKVKADHKKDINEEDENNNVKDDNFINRHPDLIVSNIKTDPEEFKPGSTAVSIKAEIKNQGNYKVHAPDDNFYAEISVYDDKYNYYIGSKQIKIDALDPGETATIVYSLDWPNDKNEYRIEVDADPYDSVDESYENNNYKSIVKSAKKSVSKEKISLIRPIIDIIKKIIENNPNMFLIIRKILQ